MILPSQRHLFDVPREVAYLNCASATPQLKESSRRLAAAAVAKGHPWTRGSADAFADAEACRALLADVLGGDAEGYAVVPSATYGAATAARILERGLQPGDGIAMMAEEFPSLVLAFRRVAAQTGASLAIAPRPDDGNWTRALLAQIRPGVKVVAISSCHWTNGAAIDLAEIAKAARAIGAALVIDGTQTLGAMPFDFDAVRPDFLVAAGYKWLMAPYGVSMLYVADRWRGERPLEESWLAREGAEEFASLTAPSDRYKPGARRFDMAEKATALLPGALAGLEQLRAWGVASIAATLDDVNARLIDALAPFGFRVASPSMRCPHFFGGDGPWNLRAVAAGLRDREIHISRRGTSLRFSPHLHVDEADIARVADAIREIVREAPAITQES